MISAMLLVVMLTLVMQYSRKRLAGTDFTFQVALMATVSGGLYSLSGILCDFFGLCRLFAFNQLDCRDLFISYCALEKHAVVIQ